MARFRLGGGLANFYSSESWDIKGLRARKLGNLFFLRVHSHLRRRRRLFFHTIVSFFQKEQSSLSARRF
jgi:hypothetical protein